MITFALPWVLAVAGASAMVVAALHWLSVRRPPERVLPTARFLPNHDVRAVSRTTRPSDLLLLLLRVLLILLAGVAIAGPSWRPSTRRTGTVVVVGAGVARDTLGIRALVVQRATPRVNADGPVSVVFADTTNQGSAVDRMGEATGTALFPLAVRAARDMALGDATIDSLDLHLVMSSPFVDRAVFDTWRAVWNGRVTLHSALPHAARSGAVPSSDTPQAVVLLDESGQRFDARSLAARNAVTGARERDDVVAAALAWHAARARRANVMRADTVRLARRGSAVSDAGIQLEWPETGVPSTWRAFDVPDTSWAVAAGGDVIDGPWVVSAEPDTVTGGRAMAWFSTGAVAATETRSSGACVRRVALMANTGSDVLLSPAANALFDRLLAPCDASSAVVPTSLTERSVYGSGLASAGFFQDGAPRGAVAARSSPSAWLTPLLLGLSILVLIVEWWARGRTGGNTRAQESALPKAANAAARAPGAT